MDPRIDRLMRVGAAVPGLVALGGGLPAQELFPRAALSAAFLRVIRDPATLQYGWPEGDEALREWIAGRLRARGATVDAADVIVTSGAQQAIDLAVRTLAAAEGRVACDAVTYPGALDVIRAQELAPTTTREGACAVYAMPAMANPLGRAATASERRDLLASASRGTFVVEDDAYADLLFAGPSPRPLLADARDRVVHVGTFSKTLCPGLRVGWIVPPPAIRERVLVAKHDVDLQANGLAQAIVADFLAHEDFDAHLARARLFYARRADRLCSALRRSFPTWRASVPEGGFAVWVETDEDVDDTELLAIALRHGVSFDPGRSFRVDGATRPLAMRLSFAVEPGRRIEDGVARLGRAWQAHRRERSRRADAA